MVKIKAKVLTRFLIIVLAFLCLIYFFPTKVSALNNEVNTNEKLASYEFQPIIDKFSYDLDDIIEIPFVLESDSQIENINSICEGVKEIKAPYIDKDNIFISIVISDKFECVKYTLIAELSNGVKIESSIYGVIEDNKLYINCNSFFGAKDIYWAEKLSDCTEENYNKIHNEYIIYLKNANFGALKESTYIVEEKEIKATKSGDDTFVSGIIQWYDDWGQAHPLQNIKLDIMDEDGGFFGWFDSKVGTTYTDEYGEYYFGFHNRSGGCNIYINIYAAGVNFVIKTGAGNDYVLRTDTNYGVATGSTTIINLDIVNGYDITQAFQISQAINVSARFAKEMSGITMPNVTVKYPHNETNPGCFYRKIENTIYIIGNKNYNFVYEGHILYSYASWDVIQHEYNHHVQHYFGLSNSHGGWHDGKNMYDHYMKHYTSGTTRCLVNGNITCAHPSSENAKEYAINLAYAEAWSSIVGAISQQYAIENFNLDSNIKTVGDTTYTSYNSLILDYEALVVGGEAYEESICSFLWDLYDPANEDYDELNLGYVGFWNLTVNGGAKNVSELVNYFNVLYPSFYYASKLGSLLSVYGIAASDLEFSINSNNLPTINWNPNGTSQNLQNNSFDVIFYDYYMSEILRINTTSSSISLSKEQWDEVCYSFGTKFYVTILSYQTGNPITGGYYSDFIECIKPEESICTDIFISGNNRYQEQIIMIRPNLFINYQIFFDTSGNKVIQTFGCKDTKLYLYSLEGNLLISNDDAGYATNAFINFNFTANIGYILSIKFYNPNDFGEIKFGIIQTNVLFSTFSEIPNLSFENGIVALGQRVYVSQNSVYMYRLTITTSGNYNITTSQENGCSITDTYLYFVDPTITSLCNYDDDSGSGLNASLDLYLESNKTYLIIVSPYNITTTSGDIWLSIHMT